MMKQAAGRVVAVFLSFSGCGGDDEGNPNFSKDYANEIQKDCMQSVQCKQQRDELIEDDPFNECIKDTSNALDSDAERQAAFLQNYNRCSQFIVCDYFDCATSGATGFGDAQEPRVRYKCQAESDCRGASGMPDADPAYNVNSCVTFEVPALNALSGGQQQTWETAFLRCSTVAGCDFVNCFSMAMSTGGGG